jgi:hypothetical protein
VLRAFRRMVNVSLTAVGGQGADVWVYDLERDTPTQLTFTGPAILKSFGHQTVSTSCSAQGYRRRRSVVDTFGWIR